MGGDIKDQLGRVVDQSGNTAMPAVILVNPQLGQNIGAACRAMLNFGLTELRLVKPRDGWPNPDANAMAAGAVALIDNARVFETTAEAVADLKYVLAATARRRELEVPVIGTGEVGAQLHDFAANDVPTGILFGPEKAGLKNEDVVLADAILTYPINPAFQSLNLAQAVNIFAYIWKSAEGTSPPKYFQKDISEAASRDDLVRMFEHLEAELDTAGYFYPEAKTDLMHLRTGCCFYRIWTHAVFCGKPPPSGCGPSICGSTEPFFRRYLFLCHSGADCVCGLSLRLFYYIWRRRDVWYVDT